MNKSKFLRKSLALLLSVLMVVAMIPVGASAADTTNAVTDLTVITIDGVTVPVSNGVFAADIAGGAATATVALSLTYAGETATFTDKDGEDVAYSSSTHPTNGLTLNNFSKSGSVYTIPLTLTHGTGEKTYTIKLTEVSKQTSATLSSVKAGTNVLSAAISGKVINVQVPYGYNTTSGTGNVTVYTAEKATVSSVTAGSDGGYTVAVTQGNKITVQSESGANISTYTVKVTETEVLSAFSIGGYEGEITHTALKTPSERGIKVVFPASVLVKKDTEDNAPAYKMELGFTAIAGTKVEVTSTSQVSAIASATEVKNGKSYTYFMVPGTPNTLTSDITVDVTCKGVTTSYPLTLDTEKETDNTISEATVDGEAATISGSNITANITAQADTTKVPVVLKARDTATVTVNGASTTKGTADSDGNNTFTLSDTDAHALTVGQLKKGVVVVVTSEDGLTKQYQLKVTATGTVDSTVLNSFALRINGVTYEGTVNQNNNTVAVTVPYLTTDAQLKAATVITTCNSFVKAVNTSDADIVDGEDVFGSSATINLSTGVTGTVVATPKKLSDAADTKYTVTVKLAAPQEGNALSSISLTSAEKYNDVTSDNTYNGVRSTESGKNYITFRPAWSEANSTADLFIKDINTVNGGVAFEVTLTAGTTTITGITKIQSQLDSTKTALVQSQKFHTAADMAATASTKGILVLPEKEARKLLNASTLSISNCNVNNGTLYTVVMNKQDAQTGITLNNIKFDTTTLSSALTGTFAYGETISAIPTTLPTGVTSYSAYTTFVDFTVAKFAKLYAATNATTPKNGAYQLTANGDINNNGEADAIGSGNNALALVRQSDGSVKVYVTKNQASASTDFAEVVGFYVECEDASVSKFYPIGTLGYAAPNTEAKITAFSVAGVAGSIKAEGTENWTITVNVPMGTKVTSLVPTFTASSGATVYDGTDKVTSGKTNLDFTADKVLTVTSEDGNKTNTYTVKVGVATSFSDVKDTDWFYGNVMAAYNAGLVSGMGDGSFNPKASVTRRDFAIMVYKMLGSPTAVSGTSFSDVSDDDYGKNAIAYLKEAGFVSGDEKGHFNPTAAITRQEAACIMANAKGLKGTTDATFADDANIASWAKTAVYACRAAGVFSGDNNNKFNATNNIIRAEAATVVYLASSK